MSSQIPEYLRSAVEAILFISEKPVTLDQFRDVLEDVGAAEIKQVLAEMIEEYEHNRRGMTVVEIAGGYQMLSSPYYAEYIRNFFKVRVKEKLSRPSLETLAIVAYKQPVSRADIELIRGVNSDGVVVHLLTKGLIKIVGRKDIPGRPYLYGTTKLFLEYFGLKALDDLPKLDEVSALLKSTQEDAAILPVSDAEAQAEQQALEDKVREGEQAQADAAGLPADQADASRTDTERAKNDEDGVANEEANQPAGSFGEGAPGDTTMEPPEELKQVMEEMSKPELTDVSAPSEREK